MTPKQPKEGGISLHLDKILLSVALLLSIVGNGLKKLAVIVSEDLIVQLSIEQTMEEIEFIFQTRYFSNQESTRKWLLA